MPRASFLLPAAAHLRPYSQGHVSSLCGLYSLLNGIQLVLWPHCKLSQVQLKKLFVSGVEHLDQSKALVTVLQYGMDEDTWLQLSNALVKSASKLTGLRISRGFILRFRPGLGRRAAIVAIKRHLRSNSPILVTLWGSYDHVTVIVGYGGGRMVLFDSSGFKWIAETSLGMQHSASTKRHQITRSSVVALALRARVK